MRIRFVGTSHGVPERDRMFSAVMIESGEGIYFIDAGTPIADAILRAGRHPDSLRAVFITHRHADHVNGLVSLVDIISWYYKNSSPAIYLPDGEAEEKLTALIDSTFGGKHIRDVDYRVAEKGVIFDDGTVRVTAIPTRHIDGGRIPSFAFILECEGKRLLFTGDLSASCEDYPKEAAEGEFDLVVIEGAHFSLTEREEIFGRTRTRRMIVSHFYPKRNGGEIEKFINDMPFEVTLAEDGLDIEL